MDWGEIAKHGGPLVAAFLTGGGVGAVISPFGENWVAKKKEKREEARKVKELRRQQVAEWREGIARHRHVTTFASMGQMFTPTSAPFTNEAWYGELRTHLPEPLVNQIEKGNYTTHMQLNGTLTRMGDEVTELAKKWGIH